MVLKVSDICMPHQRKASWHCAEHVEDHNHGEGIELMSPLGPNSGSASPKIGTGYTVVHVRPSEAGTEVSGTTEGALTIGEEDEEEELSPANEGDNLLPQHNKPPGTP